MSGASHNEVFDLVDESDRPIGTALRSEVHGDPTKIHRVAHVLLFDSGGRLFLQKRSPAKDVQPNKWDTSVGGHVDAGESYRAAAIREMREELGVENAELTVLYKYLHRNDYESEYVTTFQCVHDGPVTVNPEEIVDGRFWSLREIRSAPSELFTPNFLDELQRFQSTVATQEDEP